MRGKLAYIGRARVQQKSKLEYTPTLPYPIFEGGKECGLPVPICFCETNLINFTTISAY